MRKKLQRISRYRPSILQGKLEFAPRGASLISEHPLEQKLFIALLGTLCILGCAYLYLVSASILNIMARKEAGAQIVRLQGEIATLESSYFALDKNLDAADAKSLGLVVVEETRYVYVPDTESVVLAREGR